MSDGLAFDVDTASLRSVLQALKSIDPKLATNLRRELRDAGDDIIAAQRAELTERAPKVAGGSESWRLITPRRDKNGRTRKPYIARRVTYHAGETRQGGDSDLRRQISDGLRTRVITGAKREGVEVKTTGPRIGGSNMARVWQSKQFRHPVFGGEGWAVQFGHPYFFGPVTDELRTRMQNRVKQAIDAAVDAAGSTS
ncbi:MULTISPECIES: hypothetical protein [unclassified Microbacterium]|uniref:hypothetical protein n=1 Tax=unclassified Microbacterium TaxID=2609290 RepID=UPI00301B4D93